MGRLKRRGPGGAWVEVEDAVAVLDRGLVGMAVDHYGDAGGSGAEVEVFAGVEHVDEGAAEFEEFGGGKEGGGAVGVDIAADGGYGGDAG